MTDRSFIDSADGTRIAFTRTGAGPAILVIPGNNRMAHDYERLAALLAERHDVIVLERRGRGESGPQGVPYAIEREIEDVQAVMCATGVTQLFGHSYGGLISLQAARVDSTITRAAVWEPGVSIEGSFDGSWLPEFEHRVRRGQHARAMALFLTETRLFPLKLPKPRVTLFCTILVGGKGGREMVAMMPTTPGEIREIVRLDSDGSPYSSITADILLLGGEKSPGYLTGVLQPLSEIIPRARFEIVAGLEHNAPDLNAPEIVAGRLEAFFEA